jgi:hypothetical protein
MGMSEIKYEKLYNSVLKANKAMEQDILMLRHKVNELGAENVRLRQGQVNQDGVIQQAITKRNEAMNEVLEENQRLKAALREVQGRLSNGD